MAITNYRGTKKRGYSLGDPMAKFFFPHPLGKNHIWGRDYPNPLGKNDPPQMFKWRQFRNMGSYFKAFPKEYQIVPDSVTLPGLYNLSVV